MRFTVKTRIYLLLTLLPALAGCPIRDGDDDSGETGDSSSGTGSGTDGTATTTEAATDTTGP